MSSVVWDLDRAVPCKYCKHPVAELSKDQWQHMPFPNSRDWPYGWYRCRDIDGDHRAHPLWTALLVMRLRGLSTRLRRVPSSRPPRDRWRSPSPPRRPQRPWRPL